jgi:putative acetyltransferase
MPLFTIRRALPGDLPIILELFIETIRTRCTEDYTPAQIEAWTSSAQDGMKWKKRIANDYFLVACLDHEVTGFASLKKEGHIDLLYVTRHKKRKGMATALYDALRFEALRQGKTKLTADVSITAKPFFERHGFVVVKENIDLINGIDLINYSMAGPISARIEVDL